MAVSNQGKTLDQRETTSLIGSDKVEGTAVYRSNGDRVGQIERIMIDKISGKVAYAVMSFGGFMGIGEDYYPLPWSLLTYNTQLEGYEVNVSEQQLKGAPKYLQARELGLVRPVARQAGLRLLRRRPVLGIVIRDTSETHDFGGHEGEPPAMRRGLFFFGATATSAHSMTISPTMPCSAWVLPSCRGCRSADP